MDRLAELKTFVFAVSFIIIFSALLISVPTGLEGTGADPDELSPVIPVSLKGYSDSETFCKTNLSWSGSAYFYTYSLSDRYWLWLTDNSYFICGAKILVAGFLWLGAMEYIRFVAPDGTNRGTSLTLSEIDADADGGNVVYTTYFEDTGTQSGDLICYWNVTQNPSAVAAWDNETLYLIHAVGFDSAATANIGALLVSLLLLQLPDCPLLVNILIATPVYVAIIYLLWYIIKEMIPFV